MRVYVVPERDHVLWKKILNHVESICSFWKPAFVSPSLYLGARGASTRLSLLRLVDVAHGKRVGATRLLR